MARAASNIELSKLIRDPFVRDAFARAEDDGLAPDLVGIDNPKTLDGGSAAPTPATGRSVSRIPELA